MIKITYLGDAMCDKAVSDTLEKYRNKETGKFDFQATFSPMKNLLKNSSYVLANLETPISDNESDYTYKQWEFCTAIEFAAALKACGISYVSTANNHCLDRGINGIEQTINCLDKIGLAHSGTNSAYNKRKPLVIDSLSELRGV
jgi:poly-gamma-glutamate synthesis protein (capsule biosynthesis protein)